MFERLMLDVRCWSYWSLKTGGRTWSLAETGGRMDLKSRNASQHSHYEFLNWAFEPPFFKHWIFMTSWTIRIWNVLNLLQYLKVLIFFKNGWYFDQTKPLITFKLWIFEPKQIQAGICLRRWTMWSWNFWLWLNPVKLDTLISVWTKHLITLKLKFFEP